ncbi:MAG: glycosyltransferase, partial [Bryobacteraceae bacterium]
WRLVLAGSAGFGAEAILEAIESSPCRSRISVLGYVDAATLAAWYRRAQILAFASLDEGFGIPVLEAMAAGVAVVTSTRSALPEVAGNAALLVDPLRTEELAHALRRLTVEPDFRRELCRLGRKRAEEFTWSGAVRKTWEVYRELGR